MTVPRAPLPFATEEIIAAVVMAPPAARNPPGKGKSPKPDLRKRKTGKKKDGNGKPDAEPKETAEVRLVETREAPADRLFSAPASTPALTRPLHAHPCYPSQERSARKKAAKEARKTKGESLRSEGGTRSCKICQKVRRGARRGRR